MTKDSETSAEDFFPDRKSLKAFREAAADLPGLRSLGARHPNSFR